MIADSTYHSILRIALAVVATVLVFQSGLLSESTARLATNTEMYLANAVGVSVGVAPTELNQMTAALTEQQRLLDARAEALAEREIQVELSSGGRSQDTATFILATVLFILLVLIILNYALDYVRARERAQYETATP